MSKSVKCIFIDSKGKHVSFINKELDSVDEDKLEVPFSSSSFFHLPNSKLTYVLHYNSVSGGMFNSPSSERCGFLWSNTEEEQIYDPEDPLGCNYTDCSGSALVVAYKRKRGQHFYKKDKTPPVDIDVAPEYISKKVLTFTGGGLRRTPEFTCMFSEKFNEPGEYELLLRLENRDLLASDYDLHLDHPIQMLSDQVVRFSFNLTDVTVLVGKVYDLNSKVRVVLYLTSDPSLKQIGACVLEASKAPRWIKNQLEAYFQGILLA